MGLKDSEEIIKTILGLTASQWALVIFLVVGSVSLAFWVENRYAKIEETKSSIEKTENEIKRHKDEILQMHFKTLELIRIQPKSVQEEIEKNSRATHEQYLRLERNFEKK